MGITSLQVCMDSPDWLQGQNISDDNTGLIMDSPPVTTPPGGPPDLDILSCGGRPPADRRLRPHHDQDLKCPRCDSTHTKFCYYNNYSLSQPRYFCKTCRRYWTKGGTLRNIPVGGGCRKNKKVSSNPKKSASTSSSLSPAAGHDPAGHFRPGVASGSPPLVLNVKNTELQLAFPEQLNFSAMHGPGLFFEDVGPVGYTGIDKYDDFIGMQRNGNYNFNGIGINSHSFGMPSFESGIDNPGGGLNILESCQRLMLPNDENISYPTYNHAEQINNHHHHHHEVDVKPNARVLSLEWHDCNSDAGIKDTFGYNIGGLGSWGGLMNGYGASATNPLV